MLPDLQSPLPSSPGKESVDSVGMHPSPSLRSSDPGATGSAPDGSKPRTRTVAAILRDASAPFDRSSCIVTPFDNEAMRDMQFYQSLKDKQLEILAMTNSWVFSRLVVENEKAGRAEREQERVRAQLESCVSNIRAALATLSRAVM
ncbi:hypothetical protein H4582DRAFT_2050406 [Lactarius indigo]|nr:hypothetical protein H4582DRAFT_2050406 [Lactarius indigo]